MKVHKFRGVYQTSKSKISSIDNQQRHTDNDNRQRRTDHGQRRTDNGMLTTIYTIPA